MCLIVTCRNQQKLQTVIFLLLYGIILHTVSLFFPMALSISRGVTTLNFDNGANAVRNTTP